MNESADNRSSWRRRFAEGFAWTLAVAFLWTVDTLAKLSVREQTGIGKDDFRLYTDQGTSAAAALLMIPFVIYWLRLFPLRRGQWVPAVIGHTAGSLIFAFGHYSLMVLFRFVVFRLNGMQYHWLQSYASNLIVEYQLDIKIYLAIVLIVSAYQYFRKIGQERPPPVPLQGRLVVQTGTGESVLRLADIDYIAASRNYLVVHVGEREYLLRDTINNLEERLRGEAFLRTHRSFIVNIDRIQEIRPADSGHRIRLSNGPEIPLSRSYRERVKALLAGELRPEI
ncbi:MAG TPA: LytTR family DNA-binding domain-containing protein [Woeseiaceae bacterium]|nr:LytTR family DNA-binding domain-containing protein [Woeseiaceae bacterium]